MPRTIVSLIIGLGLLLCSSVAAADGPSPTSDDRDTAEEQPAQLEPSVGSQNNFDASHRLRIYEASRLDRRRAVLYSLALPGLGNFYAEQYALGTVALMSMVFTTMFLTFGLLNDHPDLVRIGSVTGVVTYAGSAVSSYLGVRSYNEQLRRSLHVDSDRLGHLDGGMPFPRSPRAISIGWQWRF